MGSRTIAAALFLFSFATYVLFSYGGVRSPDSEVVFRTAEALATRGSFALERDLEFWPGFGARTGLDGRRYSIFGPGQAIVAAPFVRLGQALNRTRWYEGHERLIPVSHYQGTGLVDFRAGRVPSDVEPHVLRFQVTLLNSLVTAATVVVLFAILLNLTGCPAAAGSVAFLAAFGTLLLPYSGTFFSEPLALLWSLLAFGFSAGRRPVIREADAGPVRGGPGRAAFLAGLFLGLAAATHISAILFLPFFGVIVAHRSWRLRPSTSGLARDIALFAGGVGLVLALLALHNGARFGSVFETGRAIGNASEFGYGRFTNPLPGLAGLLVSSGKGLLWFCPPALIGLALWRRFWRGDALLAGTVLAAVLFRLVFVAARTDWHGGFSIGPRYLVLIVPFLMLPWAYAVRDLLAGRRWLPFAGFVALVAAATALQLAFSVGEFSSFLHSVKEAGLRQGINVLEGLVIYRRWEYSPLVAILDGRRGPWTLQWVPWSNHALWLAAASLYAVAAGLWGRWMWTTGPARYDRTRIARA